MKKLLHADLISITVSSLIAKFGSGLIGVFIPLLLLNKGLEIWQICGFYVLYSLAKLCVNYPTTIIINRHGARIGLISGYSSMAAFMILMTVYMASGQTWSLLLMPVMMALQNSFLWNSKHLHISRVMDESRKNRDLAMMANLERVAGIFAPLAGGIIGLTLGPIWLAGIAATIILISIIPVWRLDSIAGRHQQSKTLNYSIKNAPARDLIANFAFGTHAAVGVMLWPIYLAVFVPNFGQIGIIITASTAIGIVVLHFIAKRADNGKTYQVLKEGTAGLSLVHLARIFVGSNPLAITLVSAFYDITSSYQQNPWTSLYYTHTKHKGINYILSMEIAGDVAYLLLWIVLGIIAYSFEGSSFFTLAFVFASIIVWLCLLMTSDKKPLQATRLDRG